MSVGIERRGHLTGSELRRLSRLETAHGSLDLPAFLPDGTVGVVRSVDSGDLRCSGVDAVMVNAFHLSNRPGVSLVKSAGGIHAFMGWSGPVAADSGGFQVYSLIASNPRFGHADESGFVYRQGRKRQILTPEKCIQKQFQLGADIMFGLDHCTHPEAGHEVQRESVDHTVSWSNRCRAAFDRLRENRKGDCPGPLLYGVVQGGRDADLRRECAERLIDIGFEGFGFGGWPIGDDGRLVDEVALVAELTPNDLPRHALGIGKPENLAAAFRMGYQTFDCTLPTRDARRGRLFVYRQNLETSALVDADFYGYLYIGDERYARDARPIDMSCDCACCVRYSRSYLHHLFHIQEPLSHRLATLHNLRFYSRLIERLREMGPGA